MPHLYPVVIPGGQSIRGASLGFHAYSLRIDNLSNQWLQEQSTLAWVPPYALGTCIRMYGTAVALILNASPTGQPQLQPIAGEYASGFFSDEYRTEVAGVPVRQFTLVQTVSDLTEGPEPALPPVGVCRIWADPNGVLHHVHSDGTDATLIDTSTVLGGALVGRMPNPTLAPNSVGSSQIIDGSIVSADLAAGAATSLVGSYLSNSSFSTGGTLSTWLETDVRATLSGYTGAPALFSFSIPFVSSVAGATVQVGLGFNGTLTHPLYYANTPGGGYGMTASGSIITAVSTSNTRVSVFVNVSAGTVTLLSPLFSSVSAMEFRR